MRKPREVKVESELLEGFSKAQCNAAALLGCVWRATDPKNYRVKPYEIWSYFENNARSAAMSSATLSAFYEKLRARMGSEVPGGELAEALAALLALNESEARDVLRVLRKETSVAILLLRLGQEERKEARDKKKPAKVEPVSQPVIEPVEVENASNGNDASGKLFE